MKKDIAIFTLSILLIIMTLCSITFMSIAGDLRDVVIEKDIYINELLNGK